MNSAVEAIARAVLYEGYILYPYRASAIKNRHRWTPGGLQPPTQNSGPSSLRTDCLALVGRTPTLSVLVRFLHPLLRTSGGAPPVQEATEREVELPEIPLVELLTPQLIPFGFPPAIELEGEVERLQYAIDGTVEVSAARVGEDMFRVSVVVSNLTQLDEGASRDADALRTIASAHVVLRIRDGAFVSLTDPPPQYQSLTDQCRNEGVWPVLVGEPGTHDTILASPIILPDYPQVAPESPGDFYDGTEIDEMLALRVLTLTDAEKREMAADPHARAILERVELLSPAARVGLHGAVRSMGSTPRPAPGDRVRLRPRGRADAFDLLLAGKTATIVSVEIDFEGTVYFAVAVDNDPGQDLGHTGQPGHRFFFRPDEVELFLAGDRA